MARTPGTARLSGTIEPLAGGALDARDIVQTKADLTAANSFPYPYIGMETYVVAENKKYRLVGEDPTVLANWQEVGSGGGGSVTVDEDLSTTSENPVQNKVITTELNKAYKTNDSTFTDLADDDSVPVYDSSANTKKRTLWSNIKSVLKTYFDTLYKLTAGDGIVIEDGEISTDNMASEDMAEVVTPLPSVMSRLPILFDETGAEQVVGWYKYSDGTKKPVYQKSYINIPTNNGDFYAVDTGMTTFDKVVKIDGSVYATGGILPVNCPVSLVGSSKVSASAFLEIHNGTWWIKMSHNYLDNRTADVILQYTKTTDTPA